jgi:hypothetical protein
VTGNQKIGVLKNFQRWTIGHYFTIQDNDGTLAEVKDHIEIVGSDDLGMMETR